MNAYAVIETGGKQYRVEAGCQLTVEKLTAEPGSSLDLTPVLAVSNGQELTLGTPDLAAVKVTATVVQHILGPKLISFKKKRRKGYKRKIGHRQSLTVLKIESIQPAEASAMDGKE
ncbi:MAG: 50S ribosomal protein L21 [Lentisphaerae bacterium]|nr:50S ribosomal protein L21 [Lentisphaerota bacterium]